MKADGKIPLQSVITNQKSFSPTLEDLKKLGVTHLLTPASGCSCYQAPDATYTLAMAPNDDGSTGSIAIPFTFCMYGTNYTSLFINNNGNISFGSSYGTFTATGFPSASYVMVAPFWGDVDTRPAAGGTVKYKITPTAMYVNWTAVGYYSMMTDKINTFQLIITDGTDPVLPPGDNIAFCYGDMQWTTGAASSGVGGFGGVAATVGVNKGDGINYIQMGRFDQPGAAYDGGYGANDGVSWLDNQSFYFNACSGNNIAPIASITPPLVGGSGGCDTLKVCGTNDTLLIGALFLSPEIGQTTTVGINLYGTPGFSVLTNTPGNTASSTVQIIASPANAGLHMITYTAVDDGVPAQTTIININVFVDTVGLAAFNPVISGVLDFCEGSTTTLSVAPTTYDSYIWSTGSTTTTAVIDTAGDYWVTSRKGGCYKTNQVHVDEHPKPTPVIVGNHFPCSGTTTLTVDSLIYPTYLWSNSSTNDSITVGPSGSYTVSVTNSFGCTGVSPAFVLTPSTPPVISGITAICNGDSSALHTTTPYVSYLWTNGSTNDTAFTSAGSYSVTVTDSHGCVMTSPPFTVTSFNAFVNASGVASFCAGQSITLTAAPSPAASGILWSTSATSPSITVSTGGTYTVTASYPSGCTADTTLIVAPPYPLPTPAIVGNLVSCASTPTTISVDSTIYSSYLWSNASTSTSIPVLSGTYTVTVTDSHGCVNTATTTVTNFNPLVSISGNAPFCPGGSATLTAVPTIPAGAAYLWSNSASSSSVTVNTGGNYNVVLSYANGCTTSDTVTVIEYADPVAGFSPSPPSPSALGLPVTFTDLTTISPGTTGTWEWYFGDNGNVIGSTSQNPTYTYPVAGVYTVTLAVQSTNGCWDTIRQEYQVIPELSVPNIFTPNNDGKNDYLVFKNLEFKQGTALEVYNRWGNKVYESASYQNDWNGGDQSDGVYYFILNGPQLDKPITGFVQILR